MAPLGSAAATRQRRWLGLILGWGLTVCMAALVLAGLFRGMVFSSLFHAFEHHRLGTASRFAQASPMTVVQQLQTYFRSGSLELLRQPLFSYRERMHYREIKQLLRKTKTMCTWGVMGAVSLALGLLGYTRHFSGEGRRLIAIAIQRAVWLLLGAVAFCGLFALDFETQFVRLHELLFESRHWLLPPYAASIQLFPTQYFLDFFRVYTVLTLAVAILLWGLAHGLRRSDRLAY
jgi:uncharacterized membrane protein